MTNVGLFRGAVSAFLFGGALAVAPAAGGPIDECFDYEDSSWSGEFMTCAGRGSGCSICVGSVLVYKEQDDGGPTRPLGTEFAALLPASSGLDGWPDRGEAVPLVFPMDDRSRVTSACTEDPGLFDALDPRRQPESAAGRRFPARVLPPAPTP